ncbi:unnamed protein product [Vitrella brassicaformis CCMP3155]|uniref:Importin N-terminal domain-containing protein n=3 Tax=Vitrella brassicaformis TaxID=1169539 RepID=A0A0G4FLD1_VITBC|nr:unnamed protein product [Vitrella brassicaformis CCMP3155]|eukprot:CEM14572.1 unnamed protein product [Vitrella brassicaformis CCMP3155]
MEEVVQALTVLFHNTEPAAKRQADEWLKRWQQSPPAWQASNGLLSLPNAATEVYYFGAQTFRTKIQFDFHELPPAEHTALRNSLLDHLDRFKLGPSAILTQLSLAVADLSLQMGGGWPDPIATMLERFGQSHQCLELLLEVFRVLPEENQNRKVLADTDNRRHQRAFLKQAKQQVHRFLLEARQLATSRHATQKVLECWRSWLVFTDFPPAEIARSVLFADCFQAIGDDTLGDVAADSLVEILDMTADAAAQCQDEEEQENADRQHAHAAANGLPDDASGAQQVFAVAYRQAVGPLKNKFTKAAASVADSEETLRQLIQVFVALGLSTIDLLIGRVDTAEECRTLLELLYRAAAIPYGHPTHRDVCQETFPFWSRLCRILAKRFARPSDKSIEDELGAFHGILVQLVDVCLQQIRYPTGTDISTINGDFADFRQRVISLYSDILRVLPLRTVTNRLLSGMRTAATAEAAAHQQEAHLSLLCPAVREYHHLGRKGGCGGGGGAAADPDEIFDGSGTMWQLAQSLPELLTNAPPADAMNCANRTAAVDLLGAMAHVLHLRTAFIRTVLEMLTYQLLANQVDQSAVLLQDEDTTTSAQTQGGAVNPFGSEQAAPNGTHTFAFGGGDSGQRGVGVGGSGGLGEMVGRLRLKAARALREVCTSNAGALEGLAEALVQVCTSTSQSLPEEEYEYLLDGATHVILAIPQDQRFVQVLDSLCKPIITQLSAAHSPQQQQQGSLGPPRVLAMLLDRCSTVLGVLKPVKGTARSEACALLVGNGVWPLVKHSLVQHQGCEMVVERCCRVMKHALRCTGDRFKPILPEFFPLIRQGFQVHFHSPYLYAAEYIAMEFCRDPHVLPMLQPLFDELSGRALTTLRERLAKRTTDEQRAECLSGLSHLVEDCYGMFCRYTTFCPSVIAKSANLPVALEVSLQCIRVRERSANDSVFRAVLMLVCLTNATARSAGSSATPHAAAPLSLGRQMGGFGYANAMDDEREETEAEAEPEPGEERPEARSHSHSHRGADEAEKQALGEAVRPYLVCFLPSFVAELFRLMVTVPPAFVLDNTSEAVFQVVKAFKQESAPWIEGGLGQIPPAILSDAMKRDAKMRILDGSSSRQQWCLEDIQYRCEQVAMRSRDQPKKD